MSDGFFERNLKRLFRVGGRGPAMSPAFRASLGHRLGAEAARMRGAQDGVGEAVRPRLRWSAAAAAAIIVIVSGLAWRSLVHDRVGPPAVIAFASLGPVRVEADRATALSVHSGASGVVEIVRNDHVVALLTLNDGAEVVVEPDATTRLLLHGGAVHVDATRRVRIVSGGIAIDARPGAIVEVERIVRGAGPMKSWLIPGGVGAAVGAAVVAIVLHRGEAEVIKPESRPASLERQKPLIMELPASRPVAEDDRDRKLLAAERKVTDLEKKLVASKKEVDKLASDLVQKKGVTIDSITARIAELRKGGHMSVMLTSRTADLISDLKGLGAAGTQALMELLKSEDATDRFLAAKLLEDLKDPAAIPALRDVALNDKDPHAASMASHALALMEDPRSIDALKDVLANKNRSWEQAVNAMWGLANLGDAYGIEQSLAYVNDQSVPKQARAALGANIALLIRTPEMMPIVDRTVQDFHTSDQVMDIAIDYYAALRSPVGRDRLQAIVNDTRLSQTVRDSAAAALAQNQ